MAKDVSYENEILSFTLILFTEQEETNININIKPEKHLKDAIENLLESNKFIGEKFDPNA
jgi:hypothetical protein